MKHVNTSPAYIQAPITREYVENFYNLVTADAWTFAVDSGGTVARGVSGGVVLTTDTTAEDEAYIYTTAKLVPGTTSSVSFELTGRAKQSVITTASQFIGLASTFGADMIADTTPIVPETGYLNGFIFMAADSFRARYISVHNAAATVSQLLDFIPTAGSFFSYRLNYQYNSVDSSIICTPEIDPDGGQNFKPVRPYGSDAVVHPAFYQSPNVYGAFPAAGLNYGVYFKQASAAHALTWDYAAWAIRRFN